MFVVSSMKYSLVFRKPNKDHCCDAFVTFLVYSVKKIREVRAMADPRTKEELLDQIRNTKSGSESYNKFRDLSEFFAYTTDYKSHFTWRHSLGVAEKAEQMGSVFERV